MELTKESLEAKIAATQEEIKDYATKQQAEISQMQQDLQSKVRSAQKGIDNLEGKLSSYQELLAQVQPDAKPDLKVVK